MIESGISVGNNYRFIIATDAQIARFLWREAKFEGEAMYRKVLHSLQKSGPEGWALRKWMECSKLGKIPKKARVIEAHNLVPLAIRSSMATLVSGTTITPTLKANYLALGTGSTAVSNSDAQLTTETLRAAFTNRTATNNVAYLDCFFGSSQVAGQSFQEAGIFIDGSASANSGYLLSHVLSSIIVGANENLTCNCSVTFS